jgi:hypothetical protein
MTKKIVNPPTPAPAYNFATVKVGDCFLHKTYDTVFIVYQNTVSYGDYRYGLLDLSDGRPYGTPEDDIGGVFKRNMDCFLPIAKLELTPTLL